MRWIGLTGGIASGKSTVSRILMAKGYPVVDADQLAREVVMAGTDGHREVVQAFGPDAVLSGGELNRKRIADVVFTDPEKLGILESIIHPRVRALATAKRAELAAAGHALAFYDVPLLFEKNMKSLFDKVVLVSCAPDLQIQRAMARDGLSRENAEKRIRAQMPLTQKFGLADEIVLNNNGFSDLERAVDALLARL